MSVLVLLGIYYGATDGVLPALAAGVIPKDHRSGGLALLATVVAVARVISALSFGLIWEVLGVDRALILAFAGLMATIVAVSFVAFFRENPSEVN